jgi:hypothetical protein
MKFLRKYLVFRSTEKQAVAYFNTIEDAKEYRDELRKKCPYDVIDVFKKLA